MIVLERQEDAKLILLWRNSIPSIAHGLKRIMESEIPKMAIHIVNVIHNTTVMPDEMIVNRLGIIPLQNDNIDNYLYTSECNCETLECPRCTVVLNLSYTCFDKIGLVTSRDLISNDQNVYPIHHSGIPYVLRTGNEGIIISKLKQHQTLKLNCVAKKGIGKIHAKYNSTVALSVRTVPHPKVDSVLANYAGTLCKHQLKYNPVNGNLNVIDTIHCVEECDNEDARINFQTETVSLFVIESDGSMTPDRILTKSVQVLKSRIYHLLEKLREL
jgi:DNA-directed RNA polymerase II subunit RPB3